MTKLEQITEQLRTKKASGIFDIETTADGSICTKLENRVRPAEPYTVTIQPIVGRSTLKVSVAVVTDVPQAGLFAGLPIRSSLSFGNITLKTDFQEGVTFEADCPCRDGEGRDYSAVQLAESVEQVVADFRRVEELIMQLENMAKSVVKLAPGLMSR